MAAFLKPMQLVAAGCSHGSLHFVAPESGAVIRSVPLASGLVWSCAYSPSGHEVAAGCHDGCLHFVAPHSGANIRSVLLTSGLVC